MPSKVVNIKFIDPNLVDYLAFLRGKTPTSYSSLQSFIVKVLGSSINHIKKANPLKKFSATLKAPYEETLDILPE